jgi:hypothetical protein
MSTSSPDVWSRVGFAPEQRLRWLLDFGSLDPDALTGLERSAVVEEVRAFVIVQRVDPAIRHQMRSWPSPRDGTPEVMTRDEVWSAQAWLKRGIELLKLSKRWNFRPQITYELDAYNNMFWARMRATSRLELFKALAYDALRDARYKVRRCPECKRPFVPVRRQRYCSSRCSQAVRTRNWRKAHPEKIKEIRRLQYRRMVSARSRTNLSKLPRTAKKRNHKLH